MVLLLICSFASTLTRLVSLSDQVRDQLLACLSRLIDAFEFSPTDPKADFVYYAGIPWLGKKFLHTAILIEFMCTLVYKNLQDSSSVVYKMSGSVQG